MEPNTLRIQMTDEQVQFLHTLVREKITSINATGLGYYIKDFILDLSILLTEELKTRGVWED